MAWFVSLVSQTKEMEIDTRYRSLEGLVPSRNRLAQRRAVDIHQHRWQALVRAAVSVRHSQTLSSS
jgi:hypothetical protein